MNAWRFEISTELNEFIMVCSWDPIMIGFKEKFWAWKHHESDGRNWFSFVALFEAPANVCGTDTFGESGATGLVMSFRNCHLLFRSTGVFIISFGYCTGDSLLFFLVGFIAIVKGLYASVACDLHNFWAFNVCFLSLSYTVVFLALWFLNFLWLSWRIVPATIVFIVLLIVFTPISWVLYQMLSFSLWFLLILR